MVFYVCFEIRNASHPLQAAPKNAGIFAIWMANVSLREKRTGAKVTAVRERASALRRIFECFVQFLGGYFGILAVRKHFRFEFFYVIM